MNQTFPFAIVFDSDSLAALRETLLPGPFGRKRRQAAALQMGDPARIRNRNRSLVIGDEEIRIKIMIRMRGGDVYAGCLG